MAIEPDVLLNSSASDIFPTAKRVVPKKINTERFAQAAADKTLPLLTPVAWTADGWVEYAHISGAYAKGTSERIAGFVFTNEVTVSDSGEVLGNVMMEGEVDYNDIPLPAGQDQANLKAALQDEGIRLRGLFINNLDRREG